jgi:hypothetical protein
VEQQPHTDAADQNEKAAADQTGINGADLHV